MNIIEIIKEDYARFPIDPAYNIYAENVYFEDPLNKFHGLKKYKKMIKTITTYFEKIKLDLHDIKKNEQLIDTQWTLSMTFILLPWKPRLSISGRSELKLDNENLIMSHIDYWNCSIFDVLKQVFIKS